VNNRRLVDNAWPKIYTFYIYKLESIMTQAAIFMSGNSQAVRLPKSYRFNTKSVEIFRRGDEVVLREKKSTLAEALGDWPTVPEAEAQAWNTVMTEARQPAQDRDWTELLDEPRR
jgi:antitoxin VapB